MSTHELGPLPESKHEISYQRPSGHWGRLEGWTAAEIRDYTLAEVERAVEAERAEVLRELREWEAEYIQQARGGDNSGRSDARADAAREIHDHLSSSWGTRAAIAKAEGAR
jgi:signal transduction histidine kinase